MYQFKMLPKKTKIYGNDKNNDNANANGNRNENDDSEDSKTRTTRAKKPNERKFSNKIHKHESAIIYWLKDTQLESHSSAYAMVQRGLLCPSPFAGHIKREKPTEPSEKQNSF